MAATADLLPPEPDYPELGPSTTGDEKTGQSEPSGIGIVSRFSLEMK